MTPIRRLAVAVCAAASLLALPATASADCPPKYTCENAYFPSGDGTQLHADVMKPEGKSGPFPVILSGGPYFAHTGDTGAVSTTYDPMRTEPNDRFLDMITEGKTAERGYAIVYLDLRGFGGSAGCNDFGGKGEQMDMKAGIEWAASQPWSTGKVGTWGKSYDAWTEVMALDERPKGHAAAVIMAPIIAGYRTLYQDGVHYAAGWYVTPGLYQSIDATPPSPFEDPMYIAGFAQGTNPACYGLNIAQQNGTLDRDTAFWKERELPGAIGSTVPVLWTHGFLDANTKPDNFMDVWSTLKGPHRAWFGQFTHVRPQDKDASGKRSTTGREGFIDEAMRWMDRYVKGVPAEQAPVENDPAVEVEDGATMKYRAEAAWPPADVKEHVLQIKGGTITNDTGNNAEGSDTGAGIWSVSQKLPHAVHMAGVPSMTFAATQPVPPRVNVFALLYDIDDKGKAKLVSRGAKAITAPGPAKLELYPQDWTFKAGHRIGLLLPPGDDEWYTNPEQKGSVSVDKAGLRLPFLRFLRSTFLPSRPSEDERGRPAPFDAASLIAGAETVLDVPPAMITPPSVTLPETTPPPAKPAKLSVKLRGKGRTLTASGTAPRGMKLTVRLRRGSKTVATKRVTARSGNRWTARFRKVKRGKYRALVSARDSGTTVRVRSSLRRVR